MVKEFRSSCVNLNGSLSNVNVYASCSDINSYESQSKQRQQLKERTRKAYLEKKRKLEEKRQAGWFSIFFFQLFFLYRLFFLNKEEALRPKPNDDYQTNKQRVKAFKAAELAKLNSKVNLHIHMPFLLCGFNFFLLLFNER